MSDEPRSGKGERKGEGRPEEEARGDEGRSEDAARKDEGRSDEEGRKETFDLKDLPPADFFTVVNTFLLPALQFLGELVDPSTGKGEPQPVLARYYIDCLGVLDEKTRGNLSPEEKKFLDDSLIRLRLQYLRISPGPGQKG